MRKSFYSAIILMMVVLLSGISCKPKFPKSTPTIAKCTYVIHAPSGWQACYAFKERSPQPVYQRLVQLSITVKVEYLDATSQYFDLVQDQEFAFDPRLHAFPLSIQSSMRTNGPYRVVVTYEARECSECGLGGYGTGSNFDKCTADHMVINGKTWHKGGRPVWQSVKSPSEQQANSTIVVPGGSKGLNMPASCAYCVSE